MPRARARCRSRTGGVGGVVHEASQQISVYRNPAEVSVNRKSGRAASARPHRPAAPRAAPRAAITACRARCPRRDAAAAPRGRWSPMRATRPRPSWVELGGEHRIRSRDDALGIRDGVAVGSRTGWPAARRSRERRSLEHVLQHPASSCTSSHAYPKPSTSQVSMSRCRRTIRSASARLAGIGQRDRAVRLVHHESLSTRASSPSR